MQRYTVALAYVHIAQQVSSITFSLSKFLLDADRIVSTVSLKPTDSDM